MSKEKFEKKQLAEEQTENVKGGRMGKDFGGDYGGSNYEKCMSQGGQVIEEPHHKIGNVCHCYRGSGDIFTYNAPAGAGQCVLA